jgi:hypothetical protein
VVAVRPLTADDCVSFLASSCNVCRGRVAVGRIYVGIVALVVPRGSKMLSARAVQRERLSFRQSVLLERKVMLPEKI